MLQRLLITTSALLIAGCVPVTQAPTPELIDPVNFALYEHRTGVFSIQMPPDWVVSDTSDDFIVNVDFSPPGSPQPLLGVTVVERAAVADLVSPGSDPAGFELEDFIAYHIESFYESGEAEFVEVERTLQPDASMRVGFLLQGADRTTQHNDFIQQSGPYFAVLRVRLPAEAGLVRTVSNISNTLRINEDSGWVGVFQGEEEASSDAVVFTGLNTFVGQNNTFEIVGQVRNNAEGSLEFVRITAQLYDAQGRLLLEQDEFVASDLMQPGEYAPFALVFTDGLPVGTVRYDLIASARYADFTARSFYGPANFAVSSEATFDESGLLVIAGQVRNEGTAPASLVKVIVTVFDAEGRVIGTDTTLVDQQRLAPGEVSAYSVSFVELGGSPTDFVVTAQGVREGE